MTGVETLIDAWQAAWCNQRAADFAPLCAPNVHYEDPLTAPPLQGVDALVDHAARLWTGLPDARLERAGERLTDGCFVAAPCRLRGTHRGELGGLPASGRSLALHGVFYCELDPAQARLLRVRAFFDLYDAATQLGVLPARGTLGERALLMLRGFGARAAGGPTGLRRGVSVRRE